MADPPEQAPDRENGNRESRLLSRNTIARGLIYSFLFTAAGLAALFFYTRTPETLGALDRIRPAYLALALALVPVDLYLGGIRNHWLLRQGRPGTGWQLSIRGNLANVFLGAITPSQLGGGVAQLYIFRRGGVDLDQGAAVTVMTFLSTMTFFVLAGAAALFGIRDLIQGAVGAHLVQYGVAALMLAFGGFVFVLWKPVLAGRALRSTGSVLRRMRGGLGERVERLGDRAVGWLQGYHEKTVWFLRTQPLAIAANFVTTAALYMTKFTIAWVVLLGLGSEGGYWEVVAIQALLLAILYFAPTPGGSGLAELGTGAFMSLVLPEYLLPIYTVLSRFFLIYVPAAIGSIVLFRQLGREANRKG